MKSLILVLVAALACGGQVSTGSEAGPDGSIITSTCDHLFDGGCAAGPAHSVATQDVCNSLCPGAVTVTVEMCSPQPCTNHGCNCTCSEGGRQGDVAMPLDGVTPDSWYLDFWTSYRDNGCMVPGVDAGH